MFKHHQYCAVIPVYNSADTIDRAIESVLAQTYPPAEVVVVDDGSVDDSAAVAARYPSPVVVVRQANAGPGAARNRGVRESSAEWVAFLDADDTWLPDKHEREMTLMSDPNVGVVHARGPSSYIPAPPNVTFENLWTENCVSLSSAVVRRTAWDAVGGFDESRALISVEDHNLWLRLAAAGWRIITYPEDLFHYTRNEGSLSLRFEQFTRAKITNLEMIGKLLELDPKTVRQRILELHIQQGRVLIHGRNLSLARRFLTVALQESPSLETLSLWLSTFVPTRLLDLRQNLQHVPVRP
ncbi:Glycosyltransferase involved in cell wall bisynthesis [Singulisphaera sp. GP187]|uniref:glycosyltransferase family 2 protein n=1 Tax=Singulisphaera sp. GP187 TaxID=1882752 RepID=UPI00092A180F|nr:glycosyltransferase family A protein [Singulisphaera sp. GP187]SIN94008.1 Glycosyltransferase involved in cell wall bisynthesis [Singulisphaera sp. GP187]